MSAECRALIAEECALCPQTRLNWVLWFQHGSTIIVFAPDAFTLCENVQQGSVIRMGQPLMRLP